MYFGEYSGPEKERSYEENALRKRKEERRGMVERKVTPTGC
jgi:hypothetical protein